MWLASPSQCHPRPSPPLPCTAPSPLSLPTSDIPTTSLHGPSPPFCADPDHLFPLIHSRHHHPFHCRPLTSPPFPTSAPPPLSLPASDIPTISYLDPTAPFIADHNQPHLFLACTPPRPTRPSPFQLIFSCESETACSLHTSPLHTSPRCTRHMHPNSTLDRRNFMSRTRPVVCRHPHRQTIGPRFATHAFAFPLSALTVVGTRRSKEGGERFAEVAENRK